MKLSEFGCVQKLVDFLRVNTDDELMEITGELPSSNSSFNAGIQ